MNPAGSPQDPDFTEREPRTHVAVLGGIELLSLESIDWIEAANHHVYMHRVVQKTGSCQHHWAH